jgi:hypothetical protein
MMRKFYLLILFLFAIPCYAVNCNPSNTNWTGCPATWGAISGITVGSTTPLAIPNTAWTAPNGASTTGIDIIYEVSTNSANCPYAAGSDDIQSTCNVTEVMPAEAISNPSHFEPIFCYNGGGFYEYGVEVRDCFGSTLITNPILAVQQCLSKVNVYGYNGCVIFLVNYRKTIYNTPGTNTYPLQWQDGKCPVWYVVANQNVFYGNFAVIGLYGTSSGSWFSFIVSETPDNMYTASCAASAPSSPPLYRAVPAWNVGSTMYTHGNSSWENSPASDDIFTAWFNCTNQSTCQVACAAFTDTCDPTQYLLNQGPSNLAILQRTKLMYEGGSIDCELPQWFPTTGSYSCTNPPTGSNVTGGNMYQPIAAFQAMGFYPTVDTIIGGHVSDLGVTNWTNGLPQSANDAFNFILNYTAHGTGSLMGFGAF